MKKNLFAFLFLFLVFIIVLATSTFGGGIGGDALTNGVTGSSGSSGSTTDPTKLPLTGGTMVGSTTFNASATFRDGLAMPTLSWIIDGEKNFNLIRGAFAGYASSYHSVQIGETGVQKGISFLQDPRLVRGSTFSPSNWFFFPATASFFMPNEDMTDWKNIGALTASAEVILGSTTDAGNFRAQIVGDGYIDGNLYYPSSLSFFKSTTLAMLLNSGGELQIGSTTDKGAYPLQVTGNSYLNGSVTIATMTTASSTGYAISFVGDSDTGIIASGANNIAMTGGGLLNNFWGFTANNLIGYAGAARTFYLGGNNTGVGVNCPQAGTYNTSLGYRAGQNGDYGTYNTYIGADSGYFGQSSPLGYSLAIGPNSFNTASFTANIGGGQINRFVIGSHTAPMLLLTATGTSITKPISHVVASDGYQVYQGNYYTLGLKSASFNLPLNADATTITMASGTAAFVEADVVMRQVASAEAVIWHLRSTISANNNAPFEFSASSTVRDAYNCADDCSVRIAPGVPGFNIIASGGDMTLWQVKKLTVGGL